MTVPRILAMICALTAAASLSGAAMPAAAHAAPTIGGFFAYATATPVKIDIYEDTIPIPAEPQAELSLAYTVTDAASGPTASGRASWLWPGDPVGEGFKTIGEAVGLPPELTEDGYPVQVNSRSPGEPGSASDEPVPGVVQRTSATEETAVAKVGYSPDGDVAEQNGTEDSSLPGLPGTETREQPRDGSGDPAEPVLPQELAALVDAGGMSSLSRSAYGASEVSSVASSRVTDLSLLSGLITADSVRVSTTTTSTLARATTDSTARYTGLRLAGNAITVGPDGVEGAGERAPLPDLPEDPAQALEQLGISIFAPNPRREVSGSRARLVRQGLKLIVDTGVLRSKIDSGALDEVIGRVPDDMGELKNLLDALVHLTPTIVVSLGFAASATDALPEITFPPPPMSGSAVGADVPSGLSGEHDPGPLVSPGVPAGAAALDGIGEAPVPSAVAEPQAPAPALAAGLPPLGSVPGALLWGGFLLAAVVGWWLRRAGRAVLASATVCVHGLATGLPDLRKV